MSVCHPDWRDKALCRGLTRLFFPGQGEPTKEAKALCQECPVRSECLDAASGDPPERFGIWGGLSEEGRRRLRNPRRQLRVRGSA